MKCDQKDQSEFWLNFLRFCLKSLVALPTFGRISILDLGEHQEHRHHRSLLCRRSPEIRQLGTEQEVEERHDLK